MKVRLFFLCDFSLLTRCLQKLDPSIITSALIDWLVYCARYIRDLSHMFSFQDHCTKSG